MLGELLEPIVYGIAYWTGKPIVRVVSLGRLHVGLLAEPDREGKRKQRWHSMTFTRDGKRYLHAEAVALIGMIAWGIVIAAIVLIVRHG